MFSYSMRCYGVVHLYKWIIVLLPCIYRQNVDRTSWKMKIILHAFQTGWNTPKSIFKETVYTVCIRNAINKKEWFPKIRRIKQDTIDLLHFAPVQTWNCSTLLSFLSYFKFKHGYFNNFSVRKWLTAQSKTKVYFNTLAHTKIMTYLHASLSVLLLHKPASDFSLWQLDRLNQVSGLLSGRSDIQ